MTTHRMLALAAITLGTIAMAAGEPARGGDRIDLNALADDVANERDHVSAITLAEWIRAQRPGLHVIDLRDSASYDEMHIPTATRMTLQQAAAIDAPTDAPIVLYSEGGTHAAQLWFILRSKGYRKVYFLREGMYEWVSRVLNPMLPVDATAAERREYESVKDVSRYFGGMPKRDVERSAIPDGYWHHEQHDQTPSQHDDVIDAVRRRGC